MALFSSHTYLITPIILWVRFTPQWYFRWWRLIISVLPHEAVVPLLAHVQERRQLCGVFLLSPMLVHHLSYHFQRADDSDSFDNSRAPNVIDHPTIIKKRRRHCLLIVYLQLP